MIFVIGFLVAVITGAEEGTDAHFWTAWITLAGYFGLQIIFLIWALYARRWENKKLNMDRWDYVTFGYETDNVTVLGQERMIIDHYTQEMIEKYEWGKQLDEKKVFVKGPPKKK